MYNISGYLGEFDEDIADTRNNITATACGHYKLSVNDKFQTWRPFGRQDYQLLYVAGGCADFYFGDEVQTVQAESLVLIYPGEKQHYIYLPETRPDIYWVHFSGTEAEQILKQYGFYPEHVFSVSAVKDCTLLFDRIIRELQLKRSGFMPLTSLYMQELLVLFSRNISEHNTTQTRSQIVEQAMIYFHQEYQTPISIQEYAASNNISSCWFIRTFKQHTGMTPVQYLTAIRINKAIELMKGGTFNISETAAFVGYDNPLYFSRVFKKTTGLPPREYMQNSSSRKTGL